MAPQMEFSLLGPVEVRRAGGLVPVAAGRQRALLAALLLNHRRVMSPDELIDVLWDAAPPRCARESLQNYVRRLRQALGDAGHDRIRTHAHGYLISVEPEALDISRFEARLAAARAAARDGSWETAAGQARAALALWRGEPLADVGSQVLALREGPRLAEMRLHAVEVSLDAHLHLGRHADVTGELRRLAAAHPLRERLHALLMLALYRDGRRGEALAAYQQARRVLVEELGTEPGAELRELQQRILTGDPSLATTGPGTTAGETRLATGTVPRQLPMMVADFIGRAEELAALTSQLDQAGEQPPGPVVISAIGGTAGGGKTALAVQWAHQVAGRFPDGQLYADLRGYDAGQPRPAAAILAGFLRALGVPGRDIPPRAEERAARYRSLLAGRRVLVLLDNAGEADQVRPLLPATPGCMAVVTSRDTLAGLIVREGARRLDLDLLPLAEAAGLLHTLIGERAAADPAAARLLAVQCARLPLALRIAAELAVVRHHAPLSTLVAELSDQQRRLDLLDSGVDRHTAVRAVFSWSCRHLAPQAVRTFRLLGLHPSPDFDVYASAALTGSTVAQAQQALDALIRAYLIQPAGPGRYSLHDLLRAYAAELATARDGEQEGRAALTRLFDHYLSTAAAAVDTLYPGDRHLRLPGTEPAILPPGINEPSGARSWLDAHRVTLVSAAGHHERALTLYRQAGDQVGEARALNNLGLVELRRGYYPAAASHLQRALQLCRRTGHQASEASALANLGLICLRQDRFADAASHLRRALALCRQVGDPAGEAYALTVSAAADREQGRYEQAARYLRQAVALCERTGDQSGRAEALNGLGEVLLAAGRPDQARIQHAAALDLARQIGDTYEQAHALDGLGAASACDGEPAQARQHWRRALALYTELGTPEASRVRARLAAGSAASPAGT